MKQPIIFSPTSLGAKSIFTYSSELTHTVSSMEEQSKIYMTGAIGVLESIYVHDAFQCIIGAAPVAIFVKINSEKSGSTLLFPYNTVYGKPRYRNDFRNSSTISITPFISEYKNSSS